jgi:hypothetical protein
MAFCRGGPGELEQILQALIHLRQVPRSLALSDTVPTPMPPHLPHPYKGACTQRREPHTHALDMHCCCSYKEYLREAAQHVNGLRSAGGGVQVVNLSPAWRSGEVYSYFGNSGEGAWGVGGRMAL